MTANKTSEQLISEVMKLVVACSCSGIECGEADVSNARDCIDKLWNAEDAVESKLREILQEYSKDGERLLFACEFDGYTTVEKDRYDYAIDCMEENGRDEPNKEDELNGLRRLIDAAMETKDE